jgi:hypothetical protein
MGTLHAVPDSTAQENNPPFYTTHLGQIHQQVIQADNMFID